MDTESEEVNKRYMAADIAESEKARVYDAASGDLRDALSRRRQEI